LAPTRDVVYQGFEVFPRADTAVPRPPNQWAQPHYVVPQNQSGFTGPSSSIGDPCSTTPYCHPPLVLPNVFLDTPTNPNRPATPNTIMHATSTSPPGPRFLKLGDKEWLCTFGACRSHFTRQADLVRHQNGVHLQMRPFFCRAEGCPRHRDGFPRKDKRDCHERKVHGSILVSAPFARPGRHRSSKKRKSANVLIKGEHTMRTKSGQWTGKGGGRVVLEVAPWNRATSSPWFLRCRRMWLSGIVTFGDVTEGDEGNGVGIQK
jgi:hypothetical protein